MVDIVRTTGVIAESGLEGRSYIDWPAIVAGAVLATAISFVLFTFGSAVGLGIISPYRGEGMPGLTVVILTAVWVIFVAAGSFMSGAYLTGRMRRRFHDATETESTHRDGAHGLLVWALAILVGAVLATASISGVVKAGATVAAAGVSAGAASAGAQANAGNFDLITDALFRAPANAPAATTAPATDTAGGQAMANTGPSRGETRGEVDRILARGLTSGEVATDDRKYIAQLVARETGMSRAEAETRVNATIDKTIADAKRAADIARKIAVLVAFLTAATLMVTAVGSWFAAGRGGDHRDNATDLGPLFR